MTEERKQELWRLLEEALTPGNLKILYYADRNRIYADRLSIPRKEYQKYLKERWDSFSEEPPWFYFFVRPHLANETIESNVHKGKIPKKEIGTKSKKKKVPYTEEEVAAVLKRAQDLCRESILKILEDGELPDWNSLIMGGEPDR